MAGELLQRIFEAVSGLYAPNPKKAFQDRRHLPAPAPATVAKNTAVIASNPNGGGGRIWQSSSLDTAGWTTQNAFGEILIDQDLLPDGTSAAALPMSLWLVLEGQAHGSPMCELGRSRAVPYTGLGRYTFSMVDNDSSLAMDVRASIWALSSDEDTAGRQIRFEVVCQLVAGYTF